MTKSPLISSVLVTGGAGFIGSNFVRMLLSLETHRVVVVDNLTYAGNLCSLDDVSSHDLFSFVKADISDAAAMQAVFNQFQPRRVVNFAAETHVDRSIDGPAAFIRTNVVGTFTLLEAAQRFWAELSDDEKGQARFVHVSTDEVYGSLGETGSFSEETPYAPNSPYSASKAGADHLVRAYYETYRLPAIITNCSNNYGPYQFPEKLIPLTILNALDGRELPIYGDGKNVRDWLYVLDHCEGVLCALEKGKCGEKYNIGGSNEMKNIQIVDTICEVLEELLPASKNPALKRKGVDSYKKLKKFVQDRPGHDRRYAIDASKITGQLGWRPRHEFSDAIRQTVRWYLDHRDWCEAVQTGKYDRQRLGTGR